LKFRQIDLGLSVVEEVLLSELLCTLFLGIDKFEPVKRELFKARTHPKKLC